MTPVFPGRRCFCGTGLLTLGLGLLPAQRAGAAPRTVGCLFSLEKGWASGGANFVTRQAGANDPSGIPQIVWRIREVLSVSVPIEVLIAQSENNAMATVQDGRRLVIIDVGFLKRANAMAHTRWAAIQIVAHEVGHHIAGFSEQGYRNEFSADYWSGQALQRLGADRSVSAASILSMGSPTDTSTHPNKYARASVIARGWDDAARDFIDNRFCGGCT